MSASNKQMMHVAAEPSETKAPAAEVSGVDSGSNDDEEGEASAGHGVDTASVLTEMRRAVIELGESTEGVEDATLRRFVRARAYEVGKASKMFVTHQAWRRSFVPNGSIAAPEVAHELAAEKAFLQGTDKENRPILVIHGWKHQAATRHLNQFKRYVVFCNDTIVKSMPSGVEKFTAILDLEGLAYKNLDSLALRTIFDFLQAYYPERLGRLFMIHVPYIFWPIWSIVNPFIHKDTRKKIMFVENKNLKEVLLEEIAADQLPEAYGGTARLVLIQDAVITRNGTAS